MVRVRTLFGQLKLLSPRLRECRCRAQPRATLSPLAELFSECTAPELLCMQTTDSHRATRRLAGCDLRQRQRPLDGAEVRAA